MPRLLPANFPLSLHPPHFAKAFSALVQALILCAMQEIINVHSWRSGDETIFVLACIDNNTDFPRELVLSLIGFLMFGYMIKGHFCICPQPTFVSRHSSIVTQKQLDQIETKIPTFTNLRLWRRLHGYTHNINAYSANSFAWNGFHSQLINQVKQEVFVKYGLTKLKQRPQPLQQRGEEDSMATSTPQHCTWNGFHSQQVRLKHGLHMGSWRAQFKKEAGF